MYYTGLNWKLQICHVDTSQWNTAQGKTKFSTYNEYQPFFKSLTLCLVDSTCCTWRSRDTWSVQNQTAAGSLSWDACKSRRPRCEPAHCLWWPHAVRRRASSAMMLLVQIVGNRRVKKKNMEEKNKLHSYSWRLLFNRNWRTQNTSRCPTTSTSPSRTSCCPSPAASLCRTTSWKSWKPQQLQPARQAFR